MARGPGGRGWKGCCSMCGAHTQRGVGLVDRTPHNALRRLGVKRRLTRRISLED